MRKSENLFIKTMGANLSDAICFYEFPVGQTKIIRCPPVVNKIININGIYFNLTDKRVHYNDRILRLSAAQVDIFYTIARRRGTVVSEKTIFDEVWGDEREFKREVVSNYVRHIRKVIGKRAIKTKNREGYYLNIDHDHRTENTSLQVA